LKQLYRNYDHTIDEFRKQSWLLRSIEEELWPDIFGSEAKHFVYPKLKGMTDNDIDAVAPVYLKHNPSDFGLQNVSHAVDWLQKFRNNPSSCCNTQFFEWYFDYYNQLITERKNDSVQWKANELFANYCCYRLNNLSKSDRDRLVSHLKQANNNGADKQIEKLYQMAKTPQQLYYERKLPLLKELWFGDFRTDINSKVRIIIGSLSLEEVDQLAMQWMSSENEYSFLANKRLLTMCYGIKCIQINVSPLCFNHSLVKDY
jgi:hypothetical protein